MLVGIFAYILIQLAIGFAIARRVKTESDYLVAGRSMGYPLVIFSVFGTWFGAETCIGTAGQAYSVGLSGTTHDPFGYALCLMVFGLVYASLLWKRKLTTIADLFRQRFGAGVERTTALLIVPGSLLWAAAQIRAFAQVLTSADTGIGLEVAILAATGVIIIYTASGGLLADAWTDLIQGSVIILGLIVLSVIIIQDFGSFSNAIGAIDASRLTWVQQAEGADVSIWVTINDWAVPIFGSVIAAELVSRALGARTANIAKRSSIIAALLYVAIGCMPLFFGLIGPEIIGGLSDGEQILPLLAQKYLHGALAIVFMGALVSAILSTVDSALLAASGLVVHNIVLPVLGIKDERKRLLYNRVGVVIGGVLACFMALNAGSVYNLVELASSLGSSGVVVAGTIALYSNHGGRIAAYCALIGGTVVFVAMDAISPETQSISYIASLAGALVLYYVGALCDYKPYQANNAH